MALSLICILVNILQDFPTVCSRLKTKNKKKRRENLKREERNVFLLHFLQTGKKSQILRARLVIVFKNCCLKRCENYGLKSVVEQRVFSVNKTKKCVWYHSLNNIFQYSKNVKYVFGMCVFNDKKS